MESKCSWSGVAWSGGGGPGGAKCLGNYLDHLMLLRVALSASQTATPAAPAGLGVAAVATEPCTSRWQQQQRRLPLAEPVERSPTVRRTAASTAAAAAAVQAPLPQQQQTLRPQQQQTQAGDSDEPIYYELEPSSCCVGSQRRQSQPEQAAIARLALERLSALAERGVLDVAAAATTTTSTPSRAIAPPTDGRRPATVPRAARPHAPPTRRVGGRICVADALALAGDYERTAAAGCGLLDLCGGLSSPPHLGGAAATDAIELNLLAAESEPVYERIPCDGDSGDDDDDENGDFDSVQHSSCGGGRRRRSAAAPEPPQLPPPRARGCPRTAPIKSESDACGRGDESSSADGQAGCGDKTVEKRASCPELQVCRIKMGVAAKKAWDERYVRRPSQQTSLREASTPAAAAPVLAPARATTATDYKALSVVYC